MAGTVYRKRHLPTGWYPEDAGGIENFIKKSLSASVQTGGDHIAAIVPHAGWHYSGKIAVRCIARLITEPDLVIVVGGHLAPGSAIYYAPEDVFETPLGSIESYNLITEKLKNNFKMKKDLSPDNTVEVIAPIIKYFYPDAKMVWLRAGSGPEAIDLGEEIYTLVNALKITAVVIGSTDLTHYGENFMFTPVGTGPESLEWVKEVNDINIIKKMLSMDYRAILEAANRDHSACSAGGAAASVMYASLSGSVQGKLVEYYTSYDISPSDSFVGYAGIVF